MDADNAGRLAEYMASGSVVGALLSNPATVTWLTGYAPPIESGPNPFEAGPASLWIFDDAMTVILSDAEADSALGIGCQWSNARAIRSTSRSTHSGTKARHSGPSWTGARPSEVASP